MVIVRINSLFLLFFYCLISRIIDKLQKERGKKTQFKRTVFNVCSMQCFSDRVALFNLGYGMCNQNQFLCIVLKNKHLNYNIYTFSTVSASNMKMCKKKKKRQLYIYNVLVYKRPYVTFW